MKRGRTRSRGRSEKRDFLFFAVVFLLVVVRFLYCGFRYFPQLDHYIQHHNYGQMGSVGYLIQKLGLLGARPLAGILDVTLWSWLWPCAIVGVLLLGALYAYSAIRFRQLFGRLFGTGNFFIVLFALMPLGIEGTYWMSASTRIIPGILFAALSAESFDRFENEGRKRDLLLTVLFQLLTFGFYEQAAVLSCALNILIAFLYVRKGNKRWLLSFSCILCAGVYFAFCRLSGPSPLYDGRTHIILPTTAYYFDTFLPELLSQFKSAFLGGGYYLLVYGLIRGGMRIFSDGAWIYAVIVLILCLFFGILVAKREPQKGKRLLPLLYGVLLALAPLVPFLVIENPWFSFRGTVTSFVGLALIGDTCLRLIFGKQNGIRALVSAACAFVFCICSVSEITDYRQNYEADTAMVSAIAPLAENHPDGGRIAILNVEPSYVRELNSRFHEHITGVTESSWALTGAIRCYNDNQEEWITYVPISLKEEVVYKKWEYETKSIRTMDAVYYYDEKTGAAEPLTVLYSGDSRFDLYFANGEYLGTVVEEDSIGHFLTDF